MRLAFGSFLKYNLWHKGVTHSAFTLTRAKFEQFISKKTNICIDFTLHTQMPASFTDWDYSYDPDTVRARPTLDACIQFSQSWICFCYLASLTLMIVIMLSGHTKLGINPISQPRFSHIEPWACEHHRAASETWIGPLSAELNKFNKLSDT